MIRAGRRKARRERRHVWSATRTTEKPAASLEHLTPTGMLAMNKGMYYGGEDSVTLEMVSTLRSAADVLGWDLGRRGGRGSPQRPSS
jgi:hypothetical protein